MGLGQHWHLSNARGAPEQILRIYSTGESAIKIDLLEALIVYTKAHIKSSSTDSRFRIIVAASEGRKCDVIL